MYTIFYTNISNFYENLEVILDEGMYKTPRKMHQIGWKTNHFNHFYVSMLGHGFGASQFSQFYDRI